MVTGSNFSDLQGLWWSSSAVRTDAALRVNILLEERRFLYCLTLDFSPVALGACNWSESSKWWEQLQSEGVASVFCGVPSRCTTWVPADLFDSEDSAWVGPLISHRKVETWANFFVPGQKAWAYYCLDFDVQSWVKEIESSVPCEVTLLPSEVLSALHPPRFSDAVVCVHWVDSKVEIACFQNGLLVFSNTFSASSANDTAYAIGLAYEHTSWSGLNTPLWWSGNHDQLSQSLSLMEPFVSVIHPFPSLPSLPETLGDWRSNPALLRLFQLTLCV